MTDDIIPLDEARRREKKANGANDDVTAETTGEAIERLSQLSDMEYEAVRREEARRLGFRVGVLDDHVQAAKNQRIQAAFSAAQH